MCSCCSPSSRRSITASSSTRRKEEDECCFRGHCAGVWAASLEHSSPIVAFGECEESPEACLLCLKYLYDVTYPVSIRTRLPVTNDLTWYLILLGTTSESSLIITCDRRQCQFPVLWWGERKLKSDLLRGTYANNTTIMLDPLHAGPHQVPAEQKNSLFFFSPVEGARMGHYLRY